MTPDEKRTETLEWMKTLTLKQFVELFYDAARDVKMWTYEDEEEARRFADIDESLVLARVVRDKNQDGDLTYDFHVIGLQNYAEFPTLYAGDADFTEEGKCTCGHYVLSWSTTAICPVCGNAVKLT